MRRQGVCAVPVIQGDSVSAQGYVFRRVAAE